MAENSGSSALFSFAALAAAFEKADQFAGGTLSWRKGGEPRYHTAQMAFEGRRMSDPTFYLEMPGIAAEASHDVEIVNAFLRRAGFTIQLRPLVDKRSFAVAATVAAGSKYAQMGFTHDPHHKPYLIAGKPAYALASENNTFYGPHRVRFVRTSAHGEPVIHIPGQNDVKLVVIPTNTPLMGMDIDQFIMKCISRQWEVDDLWDSVLMPNLLLNHEVDAKWLVGLNAPSLQPNGAPYIIAQALLQVLVALGPGGFEGKAAAAIEVSRELCAPDPDPGVMYRLDNPFVFAIMRSNAIVISGYVTPDDFADFEVDEHALDTERMASIPLVKEGPYVE